MRKKIIVDPYDVYLLTGYSISHCRRILREIRKLYNKLPRQKVTVAELAAYFNIAVDTILAVIAPKK